MTQLSKKSARMVPRGQGKETLEPGLAGTVRIKVKASLRKRGLDQRWLAAQMGWRFSQVENAMAPSRPLGKTTAVLLLLAVCDLPEVQSIRIESGLLS